MKLRPTRALAVACGFALAACGLLTDTSGLVGGDIAGPADTGAGDSLSPDSTTDRDALASSDGASLDGASVDGTTPQDAGSDGGSDAARDAGPTCVSDAGCATGGPCYQGKCLANPTRVVPTSAKIFALTIENGALYIGHNTEILRQPLDGGLMTTFATDGVLGDMARDPSFLYYPLNFDIRSKPFDGGPASRFHTQSDSPITAVARTGGELYYASPEPSNPGVTAVYSGSLATWSPTIESSGYMDIAGLFIAGTTVYVADQKGNAVYTFPVGDGNLKAKLFDLKGATSVFVDPPWMWLTVWADGLVLRALADGTGPREVIASGQTDVSQVVATATTVYWAAGSSVYSLPR